MRADQKVFLGLLGVAMVASSVFLGLKLLAPGDTTTEIPGAVQEPSL